MLIDVVKVKALDNYMILLTFENGETRIFDVKSYLELGNFKKIRNKEMFDTVRVVLGTVEWSNGVDIDPEVLYEDSIAIVEP